MIFSKKYIKNKNFEYVDITFNDIGRFHVMIEYLTEFNEIKINNRKDSVLKIEDLKKLLNLSEKRLMQYLNKIQLSDLIIYNKIDEKSISIFVNPMCVKHFNFEWNLDIFNMFNVFLETKMNQYEYLTIKSNWYEVNNDFKVNSINQIVDNVSGVYRLYKNDRIVYVGKSINIKSRVKDHKRDKDFDSFDFSIMNNESNKNLYEIYYIDKYKPIYNKECIENSISDVELEDLVFVDKIKLNN